MSNPNKVTRAVAGRGAFTMRLSLDNAAFEDDPNELPRILRRLADDIESGRFGSASGRIRDVNGNTVGLAEFHADAPSSPSATGGGRGDEVQ